MLLDTWTFQYDQADDICDHIDDIIDGQSNDDDDDDDDGM